METNEVTGQKKISVAQAWVMASRPATLTAAVAPVLVGCGYTIREGSFHLLPAFAALFAACLIQIGTNFANDLFDFRKGADTSERLGPTRAVQAGLLTQTQIIRGMIFVFGVALIVGAYLTWVAGPFVVLIGIVSIIAGILYTAGPYPLGYNGLGDVFVFLFFGMVGVGGTIFVLTGRIPAVAWILSIPVGSLTSAILVVNNIRDESTDRISGKKTLIVRFGREFGIVEYSSLLGIAYLIPLILVLSRHLGGSGVLPLLTMPMAGWFVYQVLTKTGKALNPLLKRTAQLVLFYAVLWATGIALG